MTDHTKQETTAMDRIEIAKAIYHATPRSKPFDKLSAFKRERILAEADAFLASLSAAGYRILGPDEVDQVTVEKCAAELASIEPDEDAAGGPANWGDFVQIARSHVRALGRKE